MAISFSFNPSPPVKETQHKCIDCIHRHILSNDIIQCGCSLQYYFKNKFYTHCSDYCSKNHHRKVHISFCFYVENNDNETVRYTDSGLGLIIETKLDDEDVIKELLQNEDIVNKAKKEINKQYKRNDIIIIPMVTAYKFYNDKITPVSDWIAVGKFLNKEEINRIMINLNNNNF